MDKLLEALLHSETAQLFGTLFAVAVILYVFDKSS